MSANAIIVVDPAQDFEESLAIIGVYPTIEAAKADTPRLRSLTYAEGGRFDPEYGDGWRDIEIQHWQDSEIIERHRQTAAGVWIS